MLDAAQRLVAADAHLRLVDHALERRVQDLIDQRRLARARHAGHRAQHAEREAHVDVAQVVLARAAQLDEPGRPPPRLGQLDAVAPRQEAPRR